MNTRRVFIGMLIGAPVAACQYGPPEVARPQAGIITEADLARWYVGSLKDDPYDVPLVNRSLMDPDLARQEVAYTSGGSPGTVVVDIDERRLYLVQGGGMATRYGIGVGREGYSLRGAGTVGRKAKWPSWTPTSTMVKLRPTMVRHADGGLSNPLGARALYLYQGKRDTLFRIHGTNEPWSIGTQVSSGCIRMLNEDVVDLYDRVPSGATVIVKGARTRRA